MKTKMKKIPYTSCGLDNIYLLNGYTKLYFDGEEATSIHDLDGLHGAIGSAICGLRRPLTGSEFRFLRLELDMSQKAVGALFKKGDQAVAKWEKGETDLPRSIDVLVRNIYMEHIGDNPKVSEMIEQINNLDRRMQEQELCFQEDSVEGWRSAA